MRPLLPGRRDLSRYWSWGSCEMEIEVPERPRLTFTRNGRMLGLSLAVGPLYISPAIYRRWGDE